MSNREDTSPLRWQSKAILLIVVPWTAIGTIIQGWWWATHAPIVAYTTLGISTLFGLIVCRLRAGTPAAAATGAAITASLMFATVRFPYEWSWLHGGLPPLLAVFLLTFAATKIGRAKKERLGTAEPRRGRNAAQVAANLGVAALIVTIVPDRNTGALFAIAALAEAAADTVSSEIGQVFGGQPRMITSFQRVEAGTDGGVTIAGTIAGVLAALLVAVIGAWAAWGFSINWFSLSWICITAAGGVFGLLFDSLLGATLERKRWLNNDAVNFLSTLAAMVGAFAGLAILAGLTAR
jgi:uncharacterized protein (TIGR00297 family)